MTKRLTAEDLAVIEARANAATAQPWHPAHDEFETMNDMTHATCVSLSRGGLTLHLALAGRTHVEAMRAAAEAGEDEDAGNVFAAIVGNGPSSAANAGFIAAARTDVPALVAEVRALTAERDELRAIVEGRKEPPTDAETIAHHAAGGSWLAAGNHGRVLTHTMREARHTRDYLAAQRMTATWWALDANSRPCAWPKVTP
jgi:hypothetical protein